MAKAGSLLLAPGVLPAWHSLSAMGRAHLADLQPDTRHGCLALRACSEPPRGRQLVPSGRGDVTVIAAARCPQCTSTSEKLSFDPSNNPMGCFEMCLGFYRNRVWYDDRREGTALEEELVLRVPKNRARPSLQERTGVVRRERSGGLAGARASPVASQEGVDMAPGQRGVLLVWSLYLAPGWYTSLQGEVKEMVGAGL